MLHKKG